MGKKSKDLKALLADYGPDALDVVASVTAGALGTSTSELTKSFAGLPVAVSGGFNTTYQAVMDGSRVVKGTPIIPNPLFLSHGHEGDSPLTEKYVRHRWLKNVGGGTVSLVGTAAATGTMVNVGSIARHAAADASTAMHIYHLHAIGRGFKQSETVSQWINAFIKMKAFKAAIRTGQLAASATPVAMASACFNVASTIGKKAIKKTMEEMCGMTAMQVHWRAYQETRIAAAHGGGTGPATDLMHEMFSRRVHRWLGGTYDVRGLIREPAGWVALNDKLLLI